MKYDVNNARAPSAFPVNLRCPGCGQNGTFQSVQASLDAVWLGKGIWTAGNATKSAGVRVCPNLQCQEVVVVFTETQKVIESYPAERLDFNHEGIPANLAETIAEAITCHANGAYRSAAMMVRRMLELLCDEAEATGKDLHQRIGNLRDKISLPNELYDAMFELKALGNDAAHIQAKAYEDIGKEEAFDSIDLAKEILKARYQLKGLVERLQAKRKIAKPVEE